MKIKLIQSQKVFQTFRLRVFLYTSTLVILAAVIAFLTTSTSPTKVYATSNETIPSGSFIINMGVTPQTVANGLKPYGMIYDLMVNYSVPVKWVIEPSKAKDGADFIYNSVSYKGGTFIIPAEYITSTVSSRISYWQTQGVQGVTTTSSISVPVYATLTNFPTSLIDNLANRQSVIIGYYVNAGISSAGYVIGTPSALQACNDLWVNPHGDPDWSTHGYLYDFVTVTKSFIWMECHSVSVMEGVKNTVTPFQQLNYLSTNGLKCYGNGKCSASISEIHAGNSTGPYTHNYPTDPVMQFMGTMSGASSGGSENWYVPQSTGAWRGTTKRLVTTSDGTSPNEGVLMAYGPAFGNPANGYVMYEAGHDLDASGTATEKVAAQRAFFNFVLLAGAAKQLTFSSYTIPSVFNANEMKSVLVEMATGTAPFTYSWSSTIGGTFASSTSASTSFTAPNTLNPLTGVLKCTVVDACGRKNFITKIITVNANTLPIELKSFSGKANEERIKLEWVTSSEINNDFFAIERSSNGIAYEEIGKVKGSGNTTYDVAYNFLDVEPLSDENFYRLTQTDFDGQHKTFPPISIKFNSKFETKNIIVGASPIPFSDHLNVSFILRSDEAVVISIMDHSGKFVKSEEVSGTAGSNTYSINDLSDLPFGIYFVTMKSSNGETKSIRVLNVR